MGMNAYLNRSGKAGIVAYDSGSDWIRLQFVDGKTYKYAADKIGASNLETMKRLAVSGEGLTTFVNSHSQVKNGYSR